MEAAFHLKGAPTELQGQLGLGWHVRIQGEVPQAQAEVRRRHLHGAGGHPVLPVQPKTLEPQVPDQELQGLRVGLGDARVGRRQHPDQIQRACFRSEHTHCALVHEDRAHLHRGCQQVHLDALDFQGGQVQSRLRHAGLGDLQLLQREAQVGELDHPLALAPLEAVLGP